MPCGARDRPASPRQRRASERFRGTPVAGSAAPGLRVYGTAHRPSQRPDRSTLGARRRSVPDCWRHRRRTAGSRRAAPISPASAAVDVADGARARRRPDSRALRRRSVAAGVACVPPARGRSPRDTARLVTRWGRMTAVSASEAPRPHLLPAERRDLPPHRRDQRVRDPGRRREGQGAQGRRQAGDRLRRRRAGLPDAGLHRRGRRRGLPPAGHAPVHPGRRAARAQGGDRREDGARLRPAGDGRPTCWSPTAASRRSTRPSPRCSTRATRCSLPAPYWTTYPEAIRLAGGVPVPVVADEQSGYLVSAAQLEAARTPRTKVLLFCSPSNPTGAVYPAEQVEEIGRWALDAGPLGAHRRDLRAPHLRRRHGAVDAGGRARAGRPLRRRQRGREDLRDDRLAGGLDARPRRRRQGRDQPAVARHVQRRERLAGRGGRRADRRPVGRGDDAGGLRPAAADDRVDAAGDPGHRLPGAAGRLLRLPVGEGPAGPADRRPDGGDQRGAGHADPGGGRGRRRPR